MIDISHQRGKASTERLINARTEKTVDNKRLGRELGWIKVQCDLREMTDFLGVDKPLLVSGTIFRQLIVDIEQVHAYLIMVFGQHTSHGQCVTAIVSRTGKDHHGRTVGPLIHDGTGQSFGGSLH